MIYDNRLKFSESQALTATAASTDNVDFSGDFDMGPGRTLWAVVTVDVALAGTVPTFEVEIQTDDNSGFSSATTIASSGTVTSAAAGTSFVIALPYANERYLRLRYVLGGTSPTVTVTSFLTDQEPYSHGVYPDADN